MQTIDAPNKFGVDFAGKTIQLLSPPRGPFSPRDAYLLAAYLVAAADSVAEAQQDGTFAGWLEAIQRIPDKSAA